MEAQSTDSADQSHETGPSAESTSKVTAVPDNEIVGLPEPPTGNARSETSRNVTPQDIRKEDGGDVHAPETSAAAAGVTGLAPVELEGDDEEPPEPKEFQRTSSPMTRQRTKGAAVEKVGDSGSTKLHRFSLYETSTRFYLIGADVSDTQFRALKIDRTAPPGQLNIVEDGIVYDKREMNQLLNAIDDGNKGVGGLKLKRSSWGVLGFIRFTDAYYMVLVTKRTQVAMVGGHYVYQIDGTDLIPLKAPNSRFSRDRNAEENRFLGILNGLDLTRNFYFSYSYNITQTLQKNIIRERQVLNAGVKEAQHDYNDMFLWNHHLLKPAHANLRSLYDWCLPVIHGFVDQSKLNIFGRSVYVTIIARRSRYFAGARFLKRGANDLGYVANDVETEQIVSDGMQTSFHASGPRLFASPSYTSYVQHRGSIPLFWTQDSTATTPKPAIDLQVDPFYSSAAMHFDHLFERYGAPVYVLNLIKARERMPRESKLLHEYRNAVEYLNQSLPKDRKIIYKAFDMSRASKTRGQDVIGTLEAIAEGIMDQTGFFHNGDPDHDSTKVQNGVARTNCIDCLDRTNAAQFVIGKRALGRQLQALGVITVDTIDYDSDAVNIFTHMFHDHGDTIAIQYGGSHLVNTMATYRKINQWQSHPRDMVESFKRYYHNSFLDAQRQDAYNLFLGNYIFAQGQPLIWNLATDYYLHHTDPRAWIDRHRKHYIKWFTPEYLEPRQLPLLTLPKSEDMEQGVPAFDDYWLEYYRPMLISSFLRIFSLRMNSTQKYLPDKNQLSDDYDVSPFRARKASQPDGDGHEKKPTRKGVKIVDPHGADQPASSHHLGEPEGGLKTPLDAVEASPAGTHGILREGSQFDNFGEKRSGLSPQSIGTVGGDASGSAGATAGAHSSKADKKFMAQWTLNQIHHNSLNPSVSGQEADEYEAYVNHPHKLGLVVPPSQNAWDDPDAAAHIELLDYINANETILAGAVGSSRAAVGGSGQVWEVSEEDLVDYAAFLEVADDPLTVGERDGEKKRYKRYRQWLRGKSLFKQSKVDPEYQAGGL